jgi:hypothetical protein
MPPLPASGAERWEVLPPTPAPIPPECSGHVGVNGISIYYAIYGEGPPVILLHGLANADLQDPERFNAAILHFLGTP